MSKSKNRDHAAGELVRLLRENIGMSRYDLVQAMVAGHPKDSRFHASARHLGRVEEEGVVPGARVKFAIASALGRQPSEIWGGRRLVVVPADFSTAAVIA